MASAWNECYYSETYVDFTNHKVQVITENIHSQESDQRNIIIITQSITLGFELLWHDRQARSKCCHLNCKYIALIPDALEMQPVYAPPPSGMDWECKAFSLNSHFLRKDKGRKIHSVTLAGGRSQRWAAEHSYTQHDPSFCHCKSELVKTSGSRLFPFFYVYAF